MEGQRFFEAIYFLVTLDQNYFFSQPIYLQFILPSVFALTIIVTMALAALYYNVINNITGRFGYMLYWVLFMLLAGGISFYLAVNKVAKIVYIGLTIGSDGWVFGINNFLFSIILFFIFSLALKWRKITTYADQLPFKTPW